MNSRRRTTRARLAAGLLTLSLCAGACTSTPKGKANVYEGSEGGQITAIESNRELAAKLAIKNPIHKREQGRLFVQFDLVNKRSTELEFAWAVDWLDAAGFRIDDTTRRWEPIRMGGYAVKTLQVVAPRPEAEQWRIQFTSRNEVK